RCFTVRTLHQREVANRKTKTRMLLGEGEAVDARTCVKLARFLNIVDCLGKARDATGIGAQIGNRWHDLNEPRAVIDHGGYKLSACNIIAEADSAAHIGHEARNISDDAVRHEAIGL